MKSNFFSIIIPVYNAENTIKSCLESVYKTNYRHFEVIVINDGSTDNSKKIIEKFPCKQITLDRRHGPSYARNVGIKQSKGDILFFMDSDSEINKDAFDLVHQTFNEEKNILGVTSVCSKNSLGDGIASNFNALKNHYSLFTTENLYTNFFTTQAGALKREVFEKYGCFNEKYKYPNIEDLELGLRLPPNKIFINKNFLVKHRFPGFFEILKKYLVRSVLISQLTKKKRKAANRGHASIKQFLKSLPAPLSLFFVGVSLIRIEFIYMSIAMVALFLTANGKFFKFIYKERGLKFACVSLFYEYIYSIAITLGVVIGLAL